MRILHLTDTHLGHVLPVRGAPAGWERAHDHHAAMAAALHPALHGAVDLVVHSGDLFHRSRPPPAAAQAAARLLLAVARRVPVVVIPGNHDRRGLRRHLGFRTPGLTIADQPTRFTLGGVSLALVPYQRTAAAWVHAARHASGPGADLVVTHQAVHGARVPGKTFRAGIERDTLGARHLAALPHRPMAVLCGHIHPRQTVDLGGVPVVHPGSTERTLLSEWSETKGTALHTLGRTHHATWIDLPTRPWLPVSDPADLDAVRPGTITWVRGPGADALESAALGRGGWVVRRRHAPRPVAPQLQAQLFPSPAGRGARRGARSAPLP